MPAPQSGSPMTYMHNGKQYIIVAISGGAYSGEYVPMRPVLGGAIDGGSETSAEQASGQAFRSDRALRKPFKA